MGECVALHHLSIVEPILDLIVTAFGGKRSRSKVQRGRGNKATSVDYTDLDAVKRAKKRDAMILMAAGRIEGISAEL